MLADSLRKIRVENNFTQQNIADVLGIDRSTYSYYESGATAPSPRTLFKLSQVYNVTVGFLMGVEENRPEYKKLPSSVAVASGYDPISVLKENEKELLMYYRILDEEKKKDAVELLKKLSKQSKEAL